MSERTVTGVKSAAHVRALRELLSPDAAGRVAARAAEALLSRGELPPPPWTAAQMSELSLRMAEAMREQVYDYASGEYGLTGPHCARCGGYPVFSDRYEGLYGENWREGNAERFGAAWVGGRLYCRECVVMLAGGREQPSPSEAQQAAGTAEATTGFDDAARPLLDVIREVLDDGPEGSNDG